MKRNIEFKYCDIILRLYTHDKFLVRPSLKYHTVCKLGVCVCVPLFYKGYWDFEESTEANTKHGLCVSGFEL